MLSNASRSFMFAALFLALGLGAGWWLRGASEAGGSEAPQALTLERAPNATGQSLLPERRIAPTSRDATSIKKATQGAVAPTRDGGEALERKTRNKEAPDSKAVLREHLDSRAFGAAMDLYQSVERRSAESAARLRQIILEYLEGYLRTGDDVALTRLAEGFLSVHYDDVAVLTLLSRHQQQSGYWAEAARTFQLAYSYSEAQPTQRSQVTQAFDRFVHAVDQPLAAEQRWQELISFYETLEQLDLSRAAEQLRLGQLYLAHGEPAAGQRLLKPLTDHPTVGSHASALLNNSSDASQARRPPPPPVGSIALEAIGNHYALPLTLDGGPQVRLVIDTGASLTTLSQQAFDRVSASARFTELGPQLFNTAGGTSSGMVYRVERLQIGEHRLEDVPIAVLDFNLPGDIDGLLGMNVLRNFRFEVDQDQHVLKLQPRP
ncbi:retropepsin-like aspartic protease [Marinimicrobium locisalis]|uniref:retropepsin-like aspartic protease n=1 Tax=Marinimicrobium locisalis TaxID=546022 RepID=UPI003221533B